MERKKLLDKYKINECGYHPFLISEGWQVAQLNYEDNQKVENITRLDIHNHTDEVFILISGNAILITARMVENVPVFELEKLQKGTTYNVPVKTWHNIAMKEGSELIIIENDNTHLDDFEFFELSGEKRIELVGKVNKLY